MSIPPTPEQHAQSVPPPLAAPPPDPASSGWGLRHPLVIALIVGCVVMLTATLVLASTALSLLRPASSAAVPTPTPTPTGDADPGAQNARGIDITTHSDLEFGQYALSDTLEGIYTYLIAPVSWSDQTSGIDVSFDITAFDAEGRILDRRPVSTYLLPGHEGLFVGLFTVQLSDVARISVEQTRAEVDAPLMTGTITMTRSETLAKSDGGVRKAYVAGAFLSTLSKAPTYPDVYFAAFADGELYAFCVAYPDIPAGGEFVDSCALTAVTREDRVRDDLLPDGAEFRAYLELDPLAER
jgi:hypothetical protein